MRYDSQVRNIGDQTLCPFDTYDVDDDGNTGGERACDRDRKDRVIESQIDMGAYERIAYATCIADADGDGRVNVNDLLVVINGWYGCAAPCPPYCQGDLDHDCAVNINDLLLVITGWGVCPGGPPTTSGPPPTDVTDCMNICSEQADFISCLQKCLCGLGYQTCP